MGRTFRPIPPKSDITEQIVQIGHFGQRAESRGPSSKSDKKDITIQIGQSREIGHKEHIVLTTIMVTYVTDRESVESLSSSVTYVSDTDTLRDLTDTIGRWGHRLLAAYRITSDDTLDHHNPGLSTITPIAMRESDITGEEYWDTLSGW